MPATDWQVGRSKVFMRGGMVEALERQRQALLELRGLTVQSHFRRFPQRRTFCRLRAAAVRTQAWARRGMAGRRYRAFVDNLVALQAAVKGALARLVAARALRQVVLVEAAARRRRDRLAVHGMLVEYAKGAIAELCAGSRDIVECQRYLNRRGGLHGLEGAAQELQWHIAGLVEETKSALRGMAERGTYQTVDEALQRYAAVLQLVPADR